MLTATMRLARDLDVAEEATADAFLLALQSWPDRGVPDSVEAWLLTTARRRAIDRIRRAGALRQRLAEMAATGPTTAAPADSALDAPAVDDDELRLVVLCCHPALETAAQVALTLRLACGAPTASVASAFLVKEKTMAARLTRAKRRIASSGDALALPDDDSVDARLPAVRRVVHLAYAAGHTAGSGTDLRDDDLAAHAVRLSRMLHRLRPGQRENAGLLALVLLTEARAGTRFDDSGAQVLLADADRSRWDAALIAEGLRLLEIAGAGGYPGPFALQAAIAAEHTRTSGPDATDWARVVRLYGELLTLEPSPTLALGRSVAIGHVAGPGAGLVDLDAVIAAGDLEGYPYAHAARAGLLARLGREPESRRAWIRAASCARTTAERDFFTTRAGNQDHPRTQ